MTNEPLLKNQRVLKFEGVINFRDLGGYQTQDGLTVRWNKMYRSAQLDRMTEQGAKDMAALGIKTVVDLRFSEETKRYPTMRHAVPDAELLSWHDEFQGNSDEQSDAIKSSWRQSLESNDPAQVREAMRLNYPKKLYSHQAIYKKMLMRLVEQQTPLVFHCAAGKDRTGVAAALILSLLGVSDEQIVEDYLLTQGETENLLSAFHAGGASGPQGNSDFQQKLANYPRALVQPVFDADLSYITTLMSYVNEHYGSFNEYALTVLGFDADHVESLRQRLLVQS
ncbi:MAG: tyrosine-protein phosphatase [Arenicella sp.]|nr:tyrosine-protein phosphatase [Arenicella sp.]